MSHSSHAANQTKTEPHPASAPGEGRRRDPRRRDDPQAPSTSATASGQTASSATRHPGTSEERRRCQGILHVPDLTRADRAPVHSRPLPSTAAPHGRS